MKLYTNIGKDKIEINAPAGAIRRNGKVVDFYNYNNTLVANILYFMKIIRGMQLIESAEIQWRSEYD